jgi:3-hydroxy-9,10-secoandrosta-1,3,5(10)-triene-9,17-dione monooxygenase reductase component
MHIRGVIENGSDTERPMLHASRESHVPSPHKFQFHPGEAELPLGRKASLKNIYNSRDMQQSFDSDLFRQALGTFTTGVTIVTTVDAAGHDVGVTANSFNSVSLAPPMVLWSLARSSTNMAAFLAARNFAVHVLASDQHALATRFAQKGTDRFAGLHLRRGVDGIALLNGCAARFECRTAFQYEGGDHVIFVGEVLNFEHCEREPLVFKRGRFALAAGKMPTSTHAGALGSSVTDGAFGEDFLLYLLGRAYYQLYQRLRPEIARRKLEDTDYLALSLLGVRDGRTVDELDALLAYTGTRITHRVAERLAELGLVELDGASGGGRRLLLTAAGRRNVIELLAVAEAASADAEKGLDQSESHVLRQLLASLVEASNPGIPHPWQG